MNILLDANISWKLTAKLQPYVTSCLHVDHIGLTVPAKDIDIWQYALDNDCIIVTNDSDFLNLSNLRGFPPKVVLLKIGNQSSASIEATIIKRIDYIIALQQSDEHGLLEIY